VKVWSVATLTQSRTAIVGQRLSLDITGENLDMTAPAKLVLASYDCNDAGDSEVADVFSCVGECSETGGRLESQSPFGLSVPGKMKLCVAGTAVPESFHLDVAGPLSLEVTGSPRAGALVELTVEGNALTDSNVVWLGIGCTGDRPPVGSIDKVFDNLLVKVSVPFGGQYTVCWCLAEDDCEAPVIVDVQSPVTVSGPRQPVATDGYLHTGDVQEMFRIPIRGFFLKDWFFYLSSTTCDEATDRVRGGHDTTWWLELSADFPQEYVVCAEHDEGGDPLELGQAVLRGPRPDVDVQWWDSRAKEVVLAGTNFTQTDTDKVTLATDCSDNTTVAFTGTCERSSDETELSCSLPDKMPEGQWSMCWWDKTVGQATVRVEAAFETGPWGPCSTDCEKGEQNRTISCRYKGIDPAWEEDLSEDYCLKLEESKPAIVQACNVGTTCPAWKAVDKWHSCQPSCGKDRTSKQIVQCMHEDVVIAEGNCTAEQPENIEGCDSVPCCTPETCSRTLKASMALSEEFTDQVLKNVLLPSLAVVLGVHTEAVKLLQGLRARRLLDDHFEVHVEISVQDTVDGTRVAKVFLDFPAEEYQAVALAKAEEEGLGEEIEDKIAAMTTVVIGEPQVLPPTPKEGSGTTSISTFVAVLAAFLRGVAY